MLHAAASCKADGKIWRNAEFQEGYKPVNPWWKKMDFISDYSAIFKTGTKCGEYKSDSEPFDVAFTEDCILTYIYGKYYHTENANYNSYCIIGIHKHLLTIIYL